MGAASATTEPAGGSDAGALVESRSDATVEEADRVLLAGASGGVGKRALKRLAAGPLAVRALTSSPEKVDRLADRGADEVVVGDLLDPDDAAGAVADCDVVVSAVGSSPRDVLLGGQLVDGEGNANLADAAAAADVRAFVMVSAIGVGPERPGPMGRLFRLTVGRTIRAKRRAEKAIRSSGVRFTILRAGALVPDRLSGEVVVAEAGSGLWGIVARDDVARLAVAAPFTPSAADRTVEVVRNPLLKGRGEVADWRGSERSGWRSGRRCR